MDGIIIKLIGVISFGILYKLITGGYKDVIQYYLVYLAIGIASLLIVATNISLGYVINPTLGQSIMMWLLIITVPLFLTGMIFKWHKIKPKYIMLLQNRALEFAVIFTTINYALSFVGG